MKFERQPNTVGRLIEELSQCPPDDAVMYFYVTYRQRRRKKRKN